MANLKESLLKNIGYEKGQFDIKKQMAKKTFGGDDFLSSLIREKLGVKKERKGKSPSKEGDEGLGTEASSVLTIIAKNTMVLPGMARDVKNLSQNIQKLVKLKGGKPTSSASDFFRKQKEKAAGKLKPGKGKSPTASVGKKAAGAAPKSGIMDILGNIVGFISGSLVEVIKSLFNPMVIIRALTKLALPLLIVGTLFSGIMAGWKKYQETGSFTDTIVSSIGGMLEFLTLGLFGEDQLKGVLDSLGEVFKPVTDSVSKIFDSVKGFFKNIFGDLIKEDEPKKIEQSSNNESSSQTSTPSKDEANKAGAEVTSKLSEAGVSTEGIPKGIFGDLQGVMQAGESGDFGAMISAGEELKKKYPVKAPPTPAPPTPVASAPESAAPTPVPSKSGGSKSADLDAQWEAQYQIVKQKNVERVAAMKALVESSAYQNASEDEKAKMMKSGPAEEARIAFNTENQKLTKLAKELESAKKSENETSTKPEGGTGGAGGTVAAPTPAPPPAPTAPTPAASGEDPNAAKAESNRMGALQFMKRSLGIMPPEPGRAGSGFTDLRNGDKPLSEEEVRKRITAAGKNPDKILELLKDTGKGGGSIDLRSGNLNQITGGAIGGGGGGGAAPSGGGGAAPSIAPSGGAPSGASISSSSAEVSEGQRMESAADKGATINAGTTNNSSSSTGKPNKQTASAYDDSFAQRLATS